MDAAEITRLEGIAKQVRSQTIKIVIDAVASHIGSAYSCTDLLVYLYEKVLRIDPKNPWDADRDRFILSKGWAISALYSVLQYKGFFPKEWLDQYCKDGTNMIGTATRNGIPGVEATTGSMGHGVPIGSGIARALKLQKRSSRVYVIMSDGESDEGSTWEAILIAAKYKLDNLTVIVDYNKLQSFGKTAEVLNLEPIADKWKAFNWAVQVIDGHDFTQIAKALDPASLSTTQPNVIIANTVKGKGLAPLENRNEWHYQTPRAAEIEAAKKEGLL